jgi:hypothetical protein
MMNESSSAQAKSAGTVCNKPTTLCSFILTVGAVSIAQKWWNFGGAKRLLPIADLLPRK